MEHFLYDWPLDVIKGPLYTTFEDFLSDEEVQKVHDLGNSFVKRRASTYVGGLEDPEVRKSTISWIPSNDNKSQWLFQKLQDKIIEVNNDRYKYDLFSIDHLQYTIYDKYEHFIDHIDISSPVRMGIRKLSFSIQLTDSEEYKGGDLTLKHIEINPVILSRKKGSISFFPSFVVHGVPPILQGERRALVGWVQGPRWR